jgi:DNA-binding response OmpR family regulator
MSTEATREQLRNGKFDAVVLNGRMPGGASAADQYRWIAANCAGMDRKLLLTFSSIADPETRAFLQEQGIPTLAKPFEVADLIAQVRKLLQKDEKSPEKAESQPEASPEDKASAASAGNL